MKKIFKVLLVALLLSGGIIKENKVQAQSVTVSLSIFQKALSPYGRWQNHSRYGQIWIANDRNFVPYQTGGHWAYTDYGWTWVSEYDWGWAPFHYGRWNWETNLGWYWVPDYNWGPAWVAWRNGGDYYGWAPLAPGLSISVGIGVGNQIPYGRWVFAPHRYITSPYINRYYVPRSRNVTIIRNTTIINNVTVRNNVHVTAGPRREDVERINHTKIRTYAVSNSSRPGKTVVNNNTINVYRPVVNKTTVNNNNNTTVINKNSNNKTVNKTNNKTTVNNNSNNKTTVNKDNNNTTVKNNSTENKKVINNQQNNKTVNKNVDSNNRNAKFKKNGQPRHKNNVNRRNNNNPQTKKHQRQNQPDSSNNGGKKK